MKRSRNKMIKSGQVPVKQWRDILVCKRECFTPRYGLWKAGDKVTDPAVIKKLSESPYFEAIKEEI